MVESASAIPPELFEADLFGYQSGAFTGAEHTRTGYLFQAQGGTFHLDEVGDLDVKLQQILLRVIEEKAFRPLGGEEPRAIDARFIASTHKDIDRMLESGAFRHDLFFRLNAARIHLPPLREMRADIPEFVTHFWRQLGGSRARLSRSALDALAEHDWPGNVRELQSVLRRLSLESRGAPDASDVRAALGVSEKPAIVPPQLFRGKSFEEVRQSLEESYLAHLIEKHSGNLAAIAAELGTTTRSVYRKFEKLGLRPKDLGKGG